MLCFPNAKINLGLYITAKRPDGYHDLNTIFYPIPPRDVLEIVPAEKTNIHISGLEIKGPPEDNLIWKAYHLLKAAYKEKVPELDIHLYKNIPMGAGLGGGSSDGAFLLTMINAYAGLGCPKEQLADFALQLGSDCPFFIYNTPCFAGGRGEQLKPVSLDLSGYEIRIHDPGIHIRTAAAFKAVTPKHPPFDLHKLPETRPEEWKEFLSNDFEEPVFQLHPQLAALKERFYEEGAVYASMSGSGSAIYGIFPKGTSSLSLPGQPARQ